MQFYTNTYGIQI